MKAAALYLFTAVATAMHVFYLMSWAIWGAPVYRIHYIALLGCATMLAAAVVTPFRHRAGAIIGLVGSVAAWCFYAPALISWAEPIRNTVQFLFTYHDYVPAIGTIVVPILLASSTAFSIYVLIRSRTR